jgi:hypothetical protein
MTIFACAPSSPAPSSSKDTSMLHPMPSRGVPSSPWKRLLRLGLQGLVALSLVTVSTAQQGCVEDIRTVNRTSPYKLEKTAFEGVWLYMQTTIDVPFSSAVSFTGETPFGQSTKVVFDIQENWLIAYPVVETIEGTEREWKTLPIRNYWQPGKRNEFVDMYVGPPMARWPIESHFDLVRNYNAFNGAQSNELTENTFDRPWYERDYFRVAWHRQGLVDFFYSLKGGNEAYFVGEEQPFHPDEFYQDPNGGYFDFVIRSLAWSVGQNRCNIYDLGQYDCARAEVKVRHSFKRYDHRRDYEPIRYHNDEHMDRFGFFLTERNAYDYDWGPTYRGSVSYANRWNLWNDNFDFKKPVDANGAEQTIACFADRDCDRDNGFRCQKANSWFSEGTCVEPVPRAFRDRKLRPIIYHLSSEWHPDYREAAYLSADSWSDVFKEAVAWLFLYEEKGVARPKACSTHADCTNGDLVADRTVRYLETGVPCHADTDCGAGQVCAAEGYCGEARACDTNSPCKAGQTCDAGFCEDASGAPVHDIISSSTPRSSTLIHAGAATMVTHDYFPTALRQAPRLPSGHAWVRFAHLAPAAGDLGLAVGAAGAETLITGGASNADLDLDPLDPTSASYIAAVPVGSAIQVAVTQAGARVKETISDFAANQHYLVIYNGDDLIVVGESYNRTTGGVRGVNAGRNSGALDFGLEGAKLAENLAYQAATTYQTASGGWQRATLSRAGGRGEFTCFQAETLGFCAGWGTDLTDADRDRVRQIKAELPEMFVLCENKFDRIAASETVAPEDYKKTLSDARYTRADGYNPCGDATRVPHPEELKRQGDARYSFFYWVNEAQRAGPLGYGPSEADPETGEIQVANANIYGGAMHTYAQYTKDLLDLVTGDLTLDRVATGQYIRDYLAAKDDPQTEAVYAALEAARSHAPDNAGAHDHSHEAAPTDAFKLDVPLDAHGKAVVAPRRDLQDYQFPELTDLMRDPARLKMAVESALPRVAPKELHDRLNRINETPLGEMMVTDEVRYAINEVAEQQGLTAEQAEAMLHPTAWTTKYAIQQERDRMQTLAKSHCLFLGEFVDDALYGLAMDMKNSGKTADEIRIEVGARILRGVLEHEVGHTVGLRHNFSGSTDVFNFFDEYYSIREKELIPCQSDSWCDQILGEVCAITACDADGDCPAGTLCGDTGECVAPDALNPSRNIATGSCSLPVEGLTCQNDNQCGDGNVCFQNRCYAPRQQFAPRFWMTESEKANKRVQYQYTTIMDYGARVNSDIQSLGKYDYAAIRFGYTQLVDTYADTSKLDKRVTDAARLTGNTPAQYSFYKNSRFWPTRGNGFFHPFNYITNYIGAEENLKRAPVPYHLVRMQRDMTVNSVREYLDVDYVEVPYAFCSDEFRGNMGCYYFDQGIDMGEMAAGATEMLWNYYVYDAFKRERIFYGSYGNPMGYYMRIMDRYYRILGDVGMFYALYDSLLFRYSWYQDWKTSPLGGRPMEQAATKAFDTLRDVIASPAPGSYKLDPARDAYVSLSYKDDQPGADFSVPFGIGRFPYTQFGSDLGYYFYEHPMWFGSFWEKLAALVTLTDSTAYFVDTFVGEQINIGIGTSLGYNTVFAPELSNFVGGIITGDLDFYAGRMVNGKYVPPSLSSGLTTNKPVEPSIDNFTMKLYSAIYGLAFIPAGFDPQFIDRLAIFFEGEARQYNPSDVAQLEEVRFRDPIGGKVYIAYSTNYGRFGQPKLDVAANLVQKAQDLADDWEAETDAAAKSKLQDELLSVREVLDLLRQLYQVYGSSTLGL